MVDAVLRRRMVVAAEAAAEDTGMGRWGCCWCRCADDEAGEGEDADEEGGGAAAEEAGGEDVMSGKGIVGIGDGMCD